MIDIEDIKIGDIVHNTGSGNSYLVIEKFGSHVVAIRTVTITNPTEWEKVEKR